MSDQYDETWTASADELAALQDLQAQLAAQREQTAAERAATQEQLDALAGARGEVQTQTRGLETDIGSFRTEQRLGWDAARTANVELATSTGGDFYAPDVGQQVAPDGTVTYDFDAHLHARGVDLDAADSTSPPNDRIVRWLRASDGGLVAQVSGYEIASEDGAWMKAQNPLVPARWASVSAVASRTAAYSRATADAKTEGASQQKTIIDSSGQSDFVQYGGSLRRLRCEGPIVGPNKSVAAGATASWGPFSLVYPQTSFAAVCGGPTAAETCTWCALWNTNQAFTIYVHNFWSAAVTVGFTGVVIYD